MVKNNYLYNICFFVFLNKIEILSRGTLAPTQAIDWFILGESMFVNDKLPYIFLQLLLSEKIGIGVPKIVETYGKEYFEFWKTQ